MIGDASSAGDVNSRPRIDYTNKDFDSLRTAMLGLAREMLPEWTDQSDNDPGVVLVDLMAYLGDILLYYQDRIANESYLETAVERRSIVNLLRLIGYELRPQQPATADLTLLFDPGATGPITIPSGAVFQTLADSNDGAIRFAYRRPALQLDLSSLPKEKYEKKDHGDDREYRVYRFLPVEQVDEIVSEADPEVLGSSDGTAGQRFRLRRAPLIGASLQVLVAENGLVAAWRRCETWLDSHSNDANYLVRRDHEGDAWVEFGDDKYGKIPARGHNNVLATYAVGGGAKGNVPPRAICKPEFADELKIKVVFNEKAASGGAEAETSAEAVLRAPQLFRARSRAVTTNDYEEYAKAFGVGKVRVKPGAWNRVNLIVAPVGGGYPSSTLRDDLKAYFENKRMLTVTVEVNDPHYVPVLIDGELVMQAHVYPEQVWHSVERAMSNLLAFEKVDFGSPLYLSRLYDAIQSLPGVMSVFIRRFKRDDSPLDLPIDGQLTFDLDELPQTCPRTWNYDTASRKWTWKSTLFAI